VRLGSLTAAGPDAALEPTLYPGGRVDVDTGGRRQVGRLHLGFALLGDIDIFAAS